jgi:hypothetical protein
MEPEDYFGVGRGAIRIDNAAGGGVFCLLWGEPGVRLVLGLVFGFAFWALFLGFCCGVLFFGFAFGFCCGVNLAFGWFWGWFLVLLFAAGFCFRALFSDFVFLGGFGSRWMQISGEHPHFGWTQRSSRVYWGDWRLDRWPRVSKSRPRWAGRTLIVFIAGGWPWLWRSGSSRRRGR